MPEALRVNGVDLGSYAFMTSDVSSLLTVPAKRGQNVVVPGRHGVITTRNKRFDANEIIIPMAVVGALPNGQVPPGSTARAEFYARRDELLRLFYAETVELSYEHDDGTVRVASTEVVDVMDFTRVAAEPLARVSVALRMNDAFWRDAEPVAQLITGATGTVVPLTEFAAATAPMSDLQVRFVGPVNNPRLQHGDGWLQYNGVIAAGRELVLDCRNWAASPGTGTGWTPDIRQVYREPGPAWLELDPSTTPFDIRFDHTGGGTATAEIAGRRSYLSP